MPDSHEIEFFKSSEIGKGLPYACTYWDKLQSTDDIFTPSLRDFHVVFWIKKGRGTYVVDFEKYDFEEGDLILLSKDQLHYFEALNKKDVDMCSVVFQSDFLYKSEMDLKHLFQFSPGIHKRGRRVIKMDADREEEMEFIFGRMNEVYQEWTDEFRSRAFYHWLSLFLIAVERIRKDQSDEVEELDSPLIMKFNQLLEENFRSEFKVEFYCQSLNITAKSLAKLCKEAYKISPKAVIEQRRLLEIKRQLKGTEKSGKQIAYDLNFGEPTNMFKFFRKHEGKSPSDFRAGV